MRVIELGGSGSRVAYTAFVGLVALQRVSELVVSRRNVGQLIARGGREIGASHYPWMVLMHTGFLLSCVAEVWVMHRVLIPGVAIASIAALAAALGLRRWTIRTLGPRWTTRVIVVPDEPLVATGPYRWIRHPNYVAVAIEIVTIPMIHTAWMTAVFFSIANVGILTLRLAVEKRALDSGRTSGSGERS